MIMFDDIGSTANTLSAVSGNDYTIGCLYSCKKRKTHAHLCARVFIIWSLQIPFWLYDIILNYVL